MHLSVLSCRLTTEMFLSDKCCAWKIWKVLLNIYCTEVRLQNGKRKEMRFSTLHLMYNIWTTKHTKDRITKWFYINSDQIETMNKESNEFENNFNETLLSTNNYSKIIPIGLSVLLQSKSFHFEFQLKINDFTVAVRISDFLSHFRRQISVLNARVRSCYRHST